MENNRRKAHGKAFSRGQWVVQRERCRIEDTSPPPELVEAGRIADVIQGLMKKLGLADQHWVGVLEEEWGKIAGEAVAMHTRPGRMEKKKLTVFVDNSMWLSELMRYGQKQLLLNLQKRFGKEKIVSVSFALDPDGKRKG